MEDLVLRSEGINKWFGGVHALADMSFELRRGEVHALVGENGAGKSTYIKILSGVYQKDSGTTLYNGEEINFKNNLEARRAGIGMVPQLIELAPMLTVAENIRLNREITRPNPVSRAVGAVLPGPGKALRTLDQPAMRDSARTSSKMSTW